MKTLHTTWQCFLIFGLVAAISWADPGVARAAAEWAKLSPFTSVKTSTNSARVRYEDHDYELVSINGLTTGQILDVCRQEYGDLWEKRFAEDLVEVLVAAGRPMAKDNTVKLVLRSVGDGKETTVERAAMTEENRRAIMLERMGNTDGQKKDARAGPAPAPQPEFNSALTPALDQFERLLLDRWSYYDFSGADFEGAITRLRARMAGGMDTDTFGLELQRIIALGMDGHSGVSGYELPRGFLPFLLEPTGGRYVAFRPDRSALLDAGHPYATKLDGQNISEWLKAAANLVPKGSPQYVERHGLRNLRYIQFMRQEIGMASGDELRVELESADRGSTMEVQLPVADQLPVYGAWPSGGSRLLESDVGYLRIAEMDDKAVGEIQTWMPRFRGTKGLIIDVRDNGGGSRDALRWLYSYLSSPDDPPRVVNAAVYRLAKEFKADHLAQRFMYREDDPVWTPAEREAIAAFKRSFHPQRPPPEGEFSDWHYLVLSALKDPAIFHYNHPVIVLMNAKCFSATDIFLTSLKGLRNVTLMGTPSGGGSALALEEKLVGTGLTVRLASMISYQGGGRLFDGNGITPDVVVEPEPGYFVGGEDTALRQAVALIKKKAG
jgi:Peptidase family S41